MSDIDIDTSDAGRNLGGPTSWTDQRMVDRIRKRYRREKLFRGFGLAAIGLAGLFLLILVGNIAIQGYPGFFQTQIRLDVTFDPDIIGSPEDFANPETKSRELRRVDFGALLRQSLTEKFPEVTTRQELRRLQGILSNGARHKLREMVAENPEVIGTRQTLWVLASDDIDQYIKGNIDPSVPEADRRVKDIEIGWIKAFQADDAIDLRFHGRFFQAGDSREPELAGILGAAVGSLLTLAVTLAIAFPIGVATAIYLEEFAPTNRFTDIIEVNINNLAAVPSIVFGLLGLAVFLSFANLPRSAPLVGGMTLALMTLPTVIIASRAAIKAVPPSIRDAARGLGASPMQVVFHHVLPLSMPGILTGTIIGMAQALGETAPLIMIGMVAFIVDIPGGFTDASTVLPVQIYIWADSPERGFVEKTSAAILVLLSFLIAMNALAIWLRNRFEQRW